AMFWTSEQGYHPHPIAYGVKAFGLASRGAYVDATVKSEKNLSLTAYAVKAEDGALYVTVINKEYGDAPQDAAVTLSPGNDYKKAQSMVLCAPSNDVTLKENITLGGSGIGDDAVFSGKWSDVPVSGS